MLHNGLIRTRDYGLNLDAMTKDDRIGLLLTKDVRGITGMVL